MYWGRADEVGVGDEEARVEVGSGAGGGQRHWLE